jgi:20S proteasome alpha/beta subunit
MLIIHGSILVYCRYYTDPSGTFWQCNAKAIGSGSEGADSSLQEQYNKVLYTKLNRAYIIS